MSRLGTAIYRAVATVAARRLGALPAVRGVYARRSLACGEVTLGKSDIDLTILLAPAADLGGESAALGALAARFAAMRRVVPVLGTCEIATRAELEDWYRSPWFPASHARDRGWLRLFGEDFAPPPIAPASAARDLHLRWLLWAWETLPRFSRAGNARTCANLLVDMQNVAYLYAGVLDAPAGRAALLARWRRDGLGGALAERLGRVLFAARPASDPALCRAIYAESLRLTDALAARVPSGLEGRLTVRELTTTVPFGFAARRYLLVDPARPVEVDSALDAMARDPAVVVTSERTLRLSWCHRNPWEYFTPGAAPARRDLSPPPAAALAAAVRHHLHRIVPRRLGLSIGRRVDRSATLGPRYAQGRLWVEHGVVADDLAALAAAYRGAYGSWPYAHPVDRDTYFAERYPLLCAEIAAIERRID